LWFEEIHEPPTPINSISGDDMPHIFKVQCYRQHRQLQKAKLGDTVYLKSRPDIPMTVSKLPHWNSAAGHEPSATVTWIHSDGSVHEHTFNAVELSL
jgi:hypothetical protein